MPLALPMPSSAVLKYGVIRSTVCPTKYYVDKTVLWTKPVGSGNGAQPDLFHPGNLSRPIMQKCIRKEDGTVIEERAFAQLNNKVVAVVNRHLLTLPRGPDWSCSKKYFTKHHAKAWAACIDEVESWEPYLTLCAGQWKAIALVQQRLLKIAAGEHAEQRRVGGQCVLDTASRKRKKPGIHLDLRPTRVQPSLISSFQNPSRAQMQTLATNVPRMREVLQSLNQVQRTLATLRKLLNHDHHLNPGQRPPNC